MQKLTRSIKHAEYQYLDLIRKIMHTGDIKNGRNGITKSIFGAHMDFSLENNSIPLITTKKLAWKTCFKELFWFMNGETDNKLLKNQNVNIWTKNATKDFLKSRGLNYREDDLGPVYGHQWRHFNAKYDTCENDYTDKGVDQLQNVVDQLKDKEDKYSRRILLSAWNPQQLDEMALPPCHVLAQFSVDSEDGLSCALYQRSGDVGLGVPFNIASYSCLTHILAKHCDLNPKKFVYFLGDAHIYEEHEKALAEQLKRKPFFFPTIEINVKNEKIDDYSLKDIKIKNYHFHKNIKMDMKA